MPEMIDGYNYDWTNSENMVLCGASSYVQKYYFNEKFNLLPEEIKNELKIMFLLNFCFFNDEFEKIDILNLYLND